MVAEEAQPGSAPAMLAEILAAGISVDGAGVRITGGDDPGSHAARW